MTSVWEQTVHEMSNVSTVCAQEGIYTGMYISDDSVLWYSSLSVILCVWMRPIATDK